MPQKPPAPPPGPPSADRPSSRKPGGVKGGARPRKGVADAAPDAADAPERIAKVLARAGIASRRDAEAIVLEGRVAVNGVVLDTPAVTVSTGDRITVDGQPLPQAERARLWLYHKPTGLVTTARDEQGRDTVFDALPEGLPRVMPVGRLDITSEGLLLLTNDGGLKRKLELPSTGWLRKYRVRVHGTPTEAQLAPLKAGIVVEGERFQPMIVGLDRQQGANAWLTVGLREGKNREIRRAMEAVGLAVNRLIRISYGPFQLGDLPAGEVEEVKPRVLRDQLGMAPEIAEEAGGTARRSPSGGRGKGAAPSGSTGRGAGADGPRPQGGGPAAGARAGGGRGAPPRAAAPAEGATPPARRSWGAKSHGGVAAARPPRDGGAEAAPAAGAAPRSWGRKSHAAASVAAGTGLRSGTSPAGQGSGRASGQGSGSKPQARDTDPRAIQGKPPARGGKGAEAPRPRPSAGPGSGPTPPGRPGGGTGSRSGPSTGPRTGPRTGPGPGKGAGKGTGPGKPPRPGPRSKG